MTRAAVLATGSATLAFALIPLFNIVHSQAGASEAGSAEAALLPVLLALMTTLSLIAVVVGGGAASVGFFRLASGRDVSSRGAVRSIIAAAAAGAAAVLLWLMALRFSLT